MPVAIFDLVNLYPRLFDILQGRPTKISKFPDNHIGLFVILLIDKNTEQDTHTERHM